MSRQFNTINDLAQYVNSITKKSLVNDVGKKVKQVMQEHVQTDVYEAYTPTQDTRTGDLAREIEIKPLNDGVVITPIREDEGRYIPYIIESGEGYNWEHSRIYKTKQKRPFVENTAQELADKNIHLTELKNSFQRKGLKSK